MVLSNHPKFCINSQAVKQSVNALKKLLGTADLVKTFILHTDASNGSAHALGAAILQEEENEERLIEYASRLLNAPERP